MDADILIIGGGIVGATIAYHVSPERRVIVLEMESQPGYHSTGRSAALFSETYGGDAIRGLTAAGRGFVETPPEGFSESPLARPRGELMIASEGDGPMLDETLEAVAARLGGRVRRVTPDEARELVPSLRREALETALYDEGVMDLDVAALHQGYLKGLARNEGRVVTNARVEAVTRIGNDFRVETSAGAFDAPILVNAAGAWADNVADRVGLDPLGLLPYRRTAILIDPPEGRDSSRWPMVIDVKETFYLKPEGGLLLASPADETPSEPTDAQAEELDVALAADRIETVFDFKVKRIVRKWAGLRTFARDRAPVLGYDPRMDGFFWAAGLGGYGVQTSPAIGRAAALLIARGPLPDDMIESGVTENRLSPARLVQGAAR